VNSLPKTVTRQRRDCDLNPGPSAPQHANHSATEPPYHSLSTLPFVKSAPFTTYPYLSLILFHSSGSGEPLLALRYNVETARPPDMLDIFLVRCMPKFEANGGLTCASSVGRFLTELLRNIGGRFEDAVYFTCKLTASYGCLTSNLSCIYVELNCYCSLFLVYYNLCDCFVLNMYESVRV